MLALLSDCGSVETSSSRNLRDSLRQGYLIGLVRKTLPFGRDMVRRTACLCFLSMSNGFPTGYHFQLFVMDAKHGLSKGLGGLEVAMN